ncbi:CmcJ/NvfI family oxidoreductase [Bradyrhizobium sp. 33ap4]|uniref:CmcJ/NvfI family oxidoreductase n=1 Tax=Bradyrhizobium sp. 33ap4 TaxID=3061630 RepID=UPI00292DAA35|nr:CmcJ/NvfI family oxidoreductase [Bradyrhizobium sp. 33ap4]
MGNAKRSSSAARVNRDDLESVVGQIGFARRTPDERPAAVTPRGYDNFSFVDHDVTIRNARPIVDELSLDKEGFALIQHRLSCANERDPEAFQKEYLDEMVPFIKDYFSASRVTTADLGGVALRSIGGDLFRRPEVEGRGAGVEIGEDAGEAGKHSVRNFGVGYAHCDYAPIAGPQIAARDSQLQGSEIRWYSRLMIIQTWCALSPPPQDLPLAFCDGSSVPETDLVVTPLTKLGEIISVWIPYYRPSHRWYYFPEMTQDEFVLFKGYDSDTHYKPRSTHSAFDNRRLYPNAKPRESVETRLYVYYD